MPAKKKTDPWATERWPISKLIGYARNPRKFDHAVPEVAAAIREFGFRVPIVAKSDGTIVDGHLRLAAVQHLNEAKPGSFDELPVLVADDLSEAQIKAFRISVNKMAEKAEWDFELLRLEIEELEAMDFGLDALGFSEEELAAFRFDEDPGAEMPGLNEGDRDPFQQMTFTLHDDQKEEVDRALAGARAMGPFGDTGNENGNGNALARICEMFNANFGGPEE